MNFVLFFTILALSTNHLHSSHLQHTSQDLDLYYLQKWSSKVLSLRDHFCSSEVASVCFDQTGAHVAIAAGKKVLCYSTKANVVKPYRFNCVVDSVSLDTHEGYLFVHGITEFKEATIQGYNVHTRELVDIGVQLALLSNTSQNHCKLSPVYNGTLTISCEDSTFLYDTKKKEIIDYKSHQSFIHKDGTKLLRSLSPKVVKDGLSYKLSTRYFLTQEGTICAHSTNPIYPCIHARESEIHGRYWVDVIKRVPNKDGYKRGARPISVSGKLSAIVRSPINPEMFMVAYQDRKKGVELQHVEGPSRWIRTHSNLHGPFCFSPDGTQFLGFDRFDLVFLTIAERGSHQARMVRKKREEQENKQRVLIDYVKKRYPRMFVGEEKQGVSDDKKVVAVQENKPKKKKKTGNRKKKKKNRR